MQTDQLLALAVPRERIFIDKGFSGTTRCNRTGLDNALTAVTSAAAAVTDRQVVLTTTKFDRFARNMAEAGEILTSLRQRDVLFGLGSQIYDWADPFGKPCLQTLAMVAEFEANLNHLRTREGMAKARAKGRLKGKQPKLPLAAWKTIHRRYHDPHATRALPTSPRNTASAAPPSTASSAEPHYARSAHVPGDTFLTVTPYALEWSRCSIAVRRAAVTRARCSMPRNDAACGNDARIGSAIPCLCSENDRFSTLTLVALRSVASRSVDDSARCPDDSASTHAPGGPFRRWSAGCFSRALTEISLAPLVGGSHQGDSLVISGG
ncbi:recombinase family protein [Nocardia pseudovaccinii]|uniref:recombinase family protein n=1 Tax=Nocardia pseudovaccinii TaxID=189540 RepID=UPI003D943E37